MNDLSPQERRNIYQFDGFADTYDKYRPKMPLVVLDILTQLAGKPRPDLVVDLACGTGISTRVWANKAENIIGIEPNDDMRRKAESLSAEPSNIFYYNGTATETNLKDESADIVTICQGIGWIDPIATFEEVARILKPHGIFAAVDYFSPATTTLEISSAESDFHKLMGELLAKYGLDQETKHYDRKNYMELMGSSGKFAYVQELGAYSQEVATAERIIGWNLSHSTTQTLLKYGLSEEEIGLSTLRAKLQQYLGDSSIPMYVTYRLKVAQKHAGVVEG